MYDFSFSINKTLISLDQGTKLFWR